MQKVWTSKSDLNERKIREPQNSWEVSYILLYTGRVWGTDTSLQEVVQKIEEPRRKQLRLWTNTPEFDNKWVRDHRSY